MHVNQTIAGWNPWGGLPPPQPIFRPQDGGLPPRQPIFRPQDGGLPPRHALTWPAEDATLARQVFGPRMSWYRGTPTATYAITNSLTDRAFDANATTLDELADVVATLYADLKAAGVL